MPSNASHKRTASSPPDVEKMVALKATKMTDYFKPADKGKPQNDTKDTSTMRKSPTETSGIEKSSAEPMDNTQSQLPEDSATTSLSYSSASSTLNLTYHTGNIFAAAPHTLLIHACNTQGSWGAGIAAAFRTRYPKAYKVYRAHCTQRHHPVNKPVPTGTALLIPPCETTMGKPKHWIGCLFTSAKYGKGKDRPDVILRNTRPAMEDCLEKSRVAGVEKVRMCKINSASFAVPWERTVRVLDGIIVSEECVKSVEVWSIE